ncbi:vitamin B12 dependent-methionine synthase activation domain-containing protein [Saccharicrinis aurantiacus]|uniref:vitamin B12 dependent-methionine synthase activation domain-containing protein n=1 Tax=Saccharicrinis aurantiacus TaxID=1849719 RepID=UPI0024924A6A|nr:vitamin B12 dependent-methionine synthase activation domain-containing protein [Saccharicrinis aurantiacus]
MEIVANNIKEYCFSINDLNITIEDLEELAPMGDMIEMYRDFLNAEIQKLSSAKSIKGGYVFVEAQEAEKDKIRTNNITFDTGKLITAYLKRSSHYVFFICTAGNEVSSRSKELMNAGELVEGYFLDTLGSVMVEKAMDQIQNELNAELKTMGLSNTNRYSPGYCDWDVAEQSKLFSLFPQQFAGVTINESCLMHPVKSVSGIMGVGTDVKYNDHVCIECNSTNCIYRDKKKH